MKRILTVLSLLAIIVFASCKKCYRCISAYSKTSTWGNHDTTSMKNTEVCGNQTDKDNFIKWNSYKFSYEDPVEFGNIYTEETKVTCD